MACTHRESAPGVDLARVQSILRDRLENRGPGAKIGAVGEAVLATHLLPYFYRRRGFHPAWFEAPRPSAQLAALVHGLKNADAEGLAPSDYHLSKIENLIKEVNAHPKRAASSSEERIADLDMLSTDAFLTYAAHLSRGKVDSETLQVAWQGACIDEGLVMILEKALPSDRVAEALAGLPPRHPFYANLETALSSCRAWARKVKWRPLSGGSPLKKGDRGQAVGALRRRLVDAGDLPQKGKKNAELFDGDLEAAVRKFQSRHGLEATGVLDLPTLAALNMTPQEKIRTLELNLERWRWLPHDLGERFIYVNVANFELEARENFRRVLGMKVVVGSEAWQTPDFSSEMTDIVINPFWTIPVPVLLKETVNYILQDPCYLENNKMVILRGRGAAETEVEPLSIDWTKISERNLDFRVRQAPGPLNVLGRLKFVFPNRHEVFLHDTPYQEDFSKTPRAFSHGCIRAEKPVELAAYVLRGKPGWDPERIQAAIDRKEELKVRLAVPVRVHFLYCTAWLDDSDAVQFRPDIYKRDSQLALALGQKPPSQ
jgi:murein L,D-transpeptidase YcbB/YkuD